MKKLLLLFTFYAACWTAVQAQLPPGSTAPNFTTTDINGTSYTLYDILDQGTTVYMDVFATWCGPCWNYHNSHAMKTIWDTYGPPGTNEAFVIAIEGDASTTVPCITNSPGCSGGTLGDWSADTPYPICDDAGVASSYAISYYPTIYCICPANKKVYECGQLPAAALWAFRANNCPAPAIVASISNVQNVICAGTNTGAIDIEVSGGGSTYNYIWSNGQNTEDLVNLNPGMYTCTITSNGLTTVVGPIQVQAPAGGPMGLGVLNVQPVGCSGTVGEITVGATGGWSNYSYNWNNGADGETLTVTSAGTYTVTATDGNGCTKTLTQYMAPAALPVASIVPPPSISCLNPVIQINASNSSSGPEFEYSWNVGNGGNIVSGETTTTPTVNAAGTYLLQITNTTTNCVSIGSTVVYSNINLPTVDAGPALNVSCGTPTTQLQGSGSTGNNFTYLWTASNGGNIVSGAGTSTPTVNAAGTYVLSITNSANGCVATDNTAVVGNNTPPNVAVSAGIVTCTTNATLTPTTNASNPTYTWSGPNSYSSTAAAPSVNSAGQYTVVVTDQTTGCTNTSTATVNANTTAPGATATGGAVTCTNQNVTLNGASTTNNVSYVWSGPNAYASNAQNPVVAGVGAYTLVVTGDNGCTSTAATAVTANNALPTAAATASGNLNCNTNQLQLNGAASSQGNNYSYQWTGTGIVSGANTLTPIVDQAGSYAIVVTNTDNGCTQTAAAQVQMTPAVTAVAAGLSNVSCNGAANGVASVTAGGGNGTYAYAWSNGSNVVSAMGLTAGTYSVVVTDGENCTNTASVTITQPDALACLATATAQTTLGVNDGTVTAAPSGGTAGYSYLWSNGATDQTIMNLAPGAYTVTLSDANGCTIVQTATVNTVNCNLSTGIDGLNSSCFGANNGSASVAVQGAANPVTYAWSNGAATATATSLAPGLYTVEVTDGNGCPATLSINITEPTQLSANATATAQTTSGVNNGSATAAPTGGVGTYTYLWNTGATTQSIADLAPGTYNVVVTDGNGCTSDRSVIVGAYDCTIQGDYTALNVSCAGAANGQATVAVTGGAAPFAYAWSNGQNQATATGLATGAYTVLITDSEGCETDVTVNITEPTVLASAIVGQSNVVCPADASGEATVEANGGTAPYVYAWSNGANGATATALSAGTYSVVATDNNGCTALSNVMITANDVEDPSLVLQNGTISLNDDGIATVTLAALSAEMADNCAVTTVTITPATFDCSHIGMQQVTVTIGDAAGNLVTSTAQVMVADNTAPELVCPASITKCHDENTVAYQYPVGSDNCSGTGTWDLVAGLASGSLFPDGATTQTFTYTDASGNVGSCSFDVIILTATQVTGLATAGCFQDCAGSLMVQGTVGGLSPYTYAWSNNQTGATVSGLCNTNVTLIVTDNAGCSTHQNINVATPAPLMMNVTSVTNDVNNQNIGAINITVQGGTAPFTYKWTKDGAAFASTEDLVNIGAGDYEVVVTDANGCEVQTENVVVTSVVSATEPTWAKGMRMVPNPTTGLVQLRFEAMLSNELEIGIVDATGRILVNITANNEQFVDLDLSHLPAGIYSVRLRSEGQVSVRKLVINR